MRDTSRVQGEDCRYLRELLTERGVNGVDAVIDGLPDVQGALATVAYYDDQRSKTTGLLLHLLRSGEHNGYRRQPAVPLGRVLSPAERDEKREAARQRWVAAGLSESEALWAAAAELTRHGTLTVVAMRAHLQREHPELYEEATP